MQYTNKLIDPFFNDFFQSESNSKLNSVMKTDIKEYEDHYQFIIELPDVKKEDVKISLNEGYLTVEETLNQVKEEGVKYIRRERQYGTYKRSFYIGDEFRSEDIKAKMDNGVLVLDCFKKPEVKEEEKFISIE